MVSCLKQGSKINHFRLRKGQSLGAPEGSGLKGLGGTPLPKLPLCIPLSGLMD